MRILQITAGTGSFHCGNCVRDNALVRALRAQGHDAVILPLYLPIIAEGENMAEGLPIFFGGVNVYLQQTIPLFRYTPRWFDKLFDSRSILESAAKKAGMTKAKDLGPLTLSTLQGEEGNQKKEVDRLIEWLKTQPKPDVVCLSNALLIGLGRRIRNEIGSAVFCTLQGEDGFLDAMVEPYKEQCWNTLIERANDIDGFIPVSRYYGDVMRERMQLPPEKVFVVPNGISLEGYREPAFPESPTLGYFARQIPDKGLHTLVEAFILLKKKPEFKPLKLRVAGTMMLGDDIFVDEQKKKLADAGLLADAEFLPNLDRSEKVDFFHSISLLSVPAWYGEAFGLYVIEAMAAGVPAVQPRHAGFVELLEDTQGGLLYEGEGAESLAQAIEPLLLDENRLREFGVRGREAVFQRYSIERMARDVADAFQTVCADAA